MFEVLDRTMQPLQQRTVASREKLERLADIPAAAIDVLAQWIFDDVLASFNVE
jgi:hypothetical protein